MAVVLKSAEGFTRRQLLNKGIYKLILDRSHYFEK